MIYPSSGTFESDTGGTFMSDTGDTFEVLYSTKGADPCSSNHWKLRTVGCRPYSGNPLGYPEYTIEKGISKLSKETDSESVQLVHILLKLSRIVKEQKHVMTLTKNGQKIALDDAQLIRELMLSFSLKYNLGYYDGYPSKTIGGLCYSIRVFLRYLLKWVLLNIPVVGKNTRKSFKSKKHPCSTTGSAFQPRETQWSDRWGVAYPH